MPSSRAVQPLPVAPPGVEYWRTLLYNRQPAIGSKCNYTLRRADRCPGFLQWPSSLSALPGGQVVVSDQRRSQLQVFSSNGTFVRTVSRLGHERGRVHAPAGIVCDSASDEFEDATCYVADRNNHRIQHLRLRDAQVGAMPARPHAGAAAPPHRRTAAPPPPSPLPSPACVRRCSAASARTAPARVS